jgi:hypothetical protein
VGGLGGNPVTSVKKHTILDVIALITLLTVPYLDLTRIFTHSPTLLADEIETAC